MNDSTSSSFSPKTLCWTPIFVVLREEVVRGALDRLGSLPLVVSVHDPRFEHDPSDDPLRVVELRDRNGDPNLGPDTL
jgi:hypothetical protein